MFKIIVVLIVCVVLILCVNYGDAIKVVGRDGRICGCIYDDNGFQKCKSNLEYTVIEVSHCD
jgi:hypothetical protein